MAALRQNDDRIVSWLHCLARLSGLGLVFLVIALAASNYLVSKPSPLGADMTLSVILMFTGMLAMGLGAMMVRRWRRLGSILVLAGALLLGLANSLNHDALEMGIVKPTFAVVGVLFFTYWWDTEQ